MRIVKLIIILLGFQITAYSQSDSTDIRKSVIKWSTYEFLDSAKNAYVDHESYFITHGDGNIEWFQNGGELVDSFLVNHVSGNWNDIKTSGTITYYASFNRINGKAIFKRDGDWITIKLVFSGMKGGDWNYTFSTSSPKIQ